MPIIACERCGAKVGDQHNYCTNCQAPLHAKNKQRSNTRQGALVGAIVGIIYGIVNAAYAYFIILSFLYPTFAASLLKSPQALAFLPMLWNILVAVAVIIVPIMSAIMGAVLGVLFVVFQKKLPGRTIIRRSVVFSLILLGISYLVGLRGYLSPSSPSILDKATLASFIWVQVVGWVLALVGFPLLGCLFGYLLTRKLGHE